MRVPYNAGMRFFFFVAVLGGVVFFIEQALAHHDVMECIGNFYTTADCTGPIMGGSGIGCSFSHPNVGDCTSTFGGSNKWTSCWVCAPPPPPPPPPSAAITSPPAGSWWNDDVSLTYDTANAGTCQLETRDGTAGAWTSRGAAACGTGNITSVLVPDWCSAEGLNQCGARIVADTAQDERNFSIDRTAPTLTTFTATDGITTVDHVSQPLNAAGASVTLNWTASDAGGSNVNRFEVWRSPDGVGGWIQVSPNLSPATTSYTDSPGVDDWWYGLHVADNTANCITQAGSHCGGVTADSLDPRTVRGPIRVVFDSTPPVAAFDTPPTPAPGSVHSNDFLIQYDATDNVSPPAQMTCELFVSTDGGASWQTKGGIGCGVNQTKTVEWAWCPTPGPNQCGVRVRAQDASGNIGNAERFYAFNQPPLVDAGNPMLEVPFGSPITLNATATDDGLPAPPGVLAITWSRTSGPGSAVFGNPQSLSTGVQLTQAGVHVIRVDVSDGAKTAFDTVEIRYGAPASYGLIPCGVIIDDPATPWDETDPCQLKHAFLLLHNVLTFTLWKLVPLLIVLLVVVTGATFFFQLGGPEVMAKVRMIWSAVGKGVLILLFSWLFLNFLLGILGFDISIFGTWYIIGP